MSFQRRSLDNSPVGSFQKELSTFLFFELDYCWNKYVRRRCPFFQADCFSRTSPVARFFFKLETKAVFSSCRKVVTRKSMRIHGKEINVNFLLKLNSAFLRIINQPTSIGTANTPSFRFFDSYHSDKGY
ncbi:hypothetical protein MAR_007873 [Mya arenaria]|uniref:Uncharacterized protein n=1 Tax=Mya arenaria TaxID=6604 RepID=A0ABY7DXD0_MYAAR|nr:hypothetical protein MAR_007873 [Mya arenaria]